MYANALNNATMAVCLCARLVCRSHATASKLTT